MWNHHWKLCTVGLHPTQPSILQSLTASGQVLAMCCWMVALRHRPCVLGGVFVLSKHFLVEEPSQISLICSCVASRRIFQKETEAWCWWGLGWSGKVYGYLGLTWSPQDLRVSGSYSASTGKLFSTTTTDNRVTKEGRMCMLDFTVRCPKQFPNGHTKTLFHQ